MPGHDKLKADLGKHKGPVTILREHPLGKDRGFEVRAPLIGSGMKDDMFRPDLPAGLSWYMTAEGSGTMDTFVRSD